MQRVADEARLAKEAGERRNLTICRNPSPRDATDDRKDFLMSGRLTRLFAGVHAVIETVEAA